MPDLDTLVTLLTTTVATWIPKIAGALAVLIIGMMVAGWARTIVRKALSRTSVDQTLIPFVAGVVRVGLVALVTIAAVSTLGVPVASFVAVLGFRNQRAICRQKPRDHRYQQPDNRRQHMKLD